MNLFYPQANAKKRKILTELFRRNNQSTFGNPPDTTNFTLPEVLATSTAMLQEILSSSGYQIFIRHIPPAADDCFALELIGENPPENGKRNFNLILFGRFISHTKLLVAAEQLLGVLPLRGDLTLALQSAAEFGITAHNGAMQHTIKIPLTAD